MKTDTQRNRQYWKNIIKKDRWFDSSFLFTIIEHKLNHMILNWDKSMYVDAHKDKEKMQEVRNAILEFQKDEFIDKYTGEIDKEYGESKIKFEDIPDSKYSTMNTYRNNELESDEARAAFREAMRKADIDKQKCLAFIFDTMRDEIEKWWD